MKQILVCLTVAVWMTFTAGSAGAAVVLPSPDVSVVIPDGWETAEGDIAAARNVLLRFFDSAGEQSSRLKALGWKTKDNDIIAAFALVYHPSGMGKVRMLLKNSSGKEREAVAARFLDSFAGKIKDEYVNKRNMGVTALSADLLEAGDDFVVIIDGKITEGSRKRLRSSTIYLHKDALLHISVIHDESVARAVRDQLDAIPLSVEWK